MNHLLTILKFNIVINPFRKGWVLIFTLTELGFFQIMSLLLKLLWKSIIKKVQENKEEKRKSYFRNLCEFKNRKYVQIESYIPDYLFFITDEKKIKHLVEYCLNNSILRRGTLEINDNDKELDNVENYVYQLIRLVESLKNNREEVLQTYKNLPKTEKIDSLINDLNSKIKELTNINSSTL